MDVNTTTISQFDDRNAEKPKLLGDLESACFEQWFGPEELSTDQRYPHPVERYPIVKGVPIVQAPKETRLHPDLDLLLLDAKAVEHCHIIVPNELDPLIAIVYEQEFYSYVKLFTSRDIIERAARKLVACTGATIVTRVAQGLVLWAWEPEAIRLRTWAS